MIYSNRLVILLYLVAALSLGVTACGDDSVQAASKAQMTISPSTLLFDGVAVGSSDRQVFTVRNTGLAPLVISEATVEGPSGVFVIDEGFVSGMQIEPDASVEFFVSYFPEVPEPATGMVRLMTNAGEGIVELEVQDSAGRVFVNPDPVRFGRVPAGESATVRTVITNLGNAPLVVSEFFLISGSNAFSIPADQQLGDGDSVELAPNERYEFDIVYEAVDNGYDSGVLIVVSDDAEEPQFEVEVEANGAEPCIEVSYEQEGYDFGERVIEQTHGAAFTVRNCSDPSRGDTLLVDAIELRNDSGYQSSEAYSLDQLPVFPLQLGPDEDLSFLVNFAPLVDQQIEEAVLQVASNDAYKPLVDVNINGRGTNNICPIPVMTCTLADSEAPPSTDLFVLPLANLDCSAEGSNDEDGDINEYIWTVAERPAGSSAEFEPDDGFETSFFVDLAGRYVFNLSVVDDRGCESPEPAVVTVVSRPDEDIHIQLVWTTPSDPDETDIGFGAGSDLDLHFLHPNGCWEDLLWDNHFRAEAPNWGDPGSSDDDPSLDIDDTDGAGPENINLNNPESGVTYKVAVHYYNDHGYGMSFATVRIFVFGELLFEARDKSFPYTDFWWVVAAIGWPSAEITEIDMVYDEVPPCR